jgi:predicted metal-binding protein
MKRKIAAIKPEEAMPPELLRRVREKGIEYGLTEVIPFSTDKIEIAHWVKLKCQYGCNRYASSWCCPPATPGTDEVKKILGEYTDALLLVGRQHRPEFDLNNARKRVKQVRIWKGAVALERMLFLEGYYKAFALVSECCGLCRQCAYPEPCRFPQEKRPSVESFSINMMATLDRIGLATEIATRKTQTMNYYSILLLD